MLVTLGCTGFIRGVPNLPSAKIIRSESKSTGVTLSTTFLI